MTSRSLSHSGTKWLAAILILAITYLIVRVPEPETVLAGTDQGYQMALGMAVAKDKLPGFDSITQYGPAVAFASFLGFLLAGNVVGELLNSVIGYAATVAMAASIVARVSGRYVASIVSIMMLLLLPRFYKWYYCLFPMTGLLFAQWYHEARMKRQVGTGIIIAWSQMVGLASLFRYDLGAEGIVFGLAAIMVAHHPTGRTSGWYMARRCGLFALGAVLPLLAYCAAILLARGVGQLFLFWRSMYDGTVDTIDYYAIAPFQFDLNGGLSIQNAVAFLQVALPVSCVYAVAVGILSVGSPCRLTAVRGYTLFTASLASLGVFPQALHRADFHHLLQVIDPFLVTLGLWVGLFAMGIKARCWVKNIAGGTALISILIALAILLPEGGADLGPIMRNPVTEWRILAGLPYSRPGNPIAEMAVALRRLTPPGSNILLGMAPTDMALLFFAQRHQPGIFPVYEAGMYSSPFWLGRNRTALIASPPDYLVMLKAPADNPAPFIPDLRRQWDKEYTVLLYSNDRYKLLGKP